jgi:predicted alpha/beta superfamily hydrolase
MVYFPRMRRHRGALVVAIVAGLAAPGISAQSRDAAVPHASQYDLKSSQDGQTYRLSIAAPFTIDPKVAYVFVGTSFRQRRILRPSSLTRGRDASGRRRNRLPPTIGMRFAAAATMTCPRPLDPAILRLAAPGIAKTGGGGAFLRFIDKDVKPFVAARFKVDSSKQTLFGYSLGGLLALQEMFNNPTAFSSYVLSSPVISWNNRKVLADEPAFAMRAKAGTFHLRILVTSAGDEQDPKNPGAVEARMIDNASELAERLAAVNLQSLVVERTIFPGETHNSVGTVSLSRGIRFALSSK